MTLVFREIFQAERFLLFLGTKMSGLLSLLEKTLPNSR